MLQNLSGIYDVMDVACHNVTDRETFGMD